MNEKQELVTMARELERLLARRRKLAKKIADLDETIRTKKKFLRDLVQPDMVDVYGLPMGGGEVGTRDD